MSETTMDQGSAAASATSPTADRSRDAATLTWQSHPAREQPGRAVMGAIWIVAAAVVVYATTFNLFWPIFAVLFLLGALNRFYFPTAFTVDETGITASSLFRTRRMNWAEVKRFAHDKEGGLLSTRAWPSQLDAYLGVQVMFGRAGERALQAIELNIMLARESIGADGRQPTDTHGASD
jgi:hypothetical protein